MSEQPSDPQGRAYTDGWRDRASGLIRHQPSTISKFYARGWNDRELRDRCAAMYAAERKSRALDTDRSPR